MRIRPTGIGMRSPQSKALRKRPVRRAFTLIELLIAMTLTLILVYAIARFFSFVGETVRDGRAQTEMGGQLRSAFLQLRKDFAEMTVRVRGRIDAGSAEGCLEIWEGIASDSDPNGDGGVNASGISTDLGDPNLDLKPDGPMLGDCDDILVLTVRSQGDDFVGRQFTGLNGNGIPVYATIRSNLAEVIWFTSFKDVNLDGAWQMTEPRYLVRRQLLIRPDLAVSWPGAPNALPAGQNIFHHNDISCHIVINNMGVATGFAANSLADLSQRENRFVHLNLTNYNQNGLPAAQGYMPNPMQLNVGLVDVPSIPLYQQGSCSVYSLDGIPQFIGEDKMLSNVLAFDVRVYDPYAVLRADNTDLNNSTGTTDDDAQGVLSPGDAGYSWAVLNTQPMGSGAYVDLWYNRGVRNLPPAQRDPVLLGSNSAYSWAPNARNFPGGAIWDNWSMAYEKDGLQQSFTASPPFRAYPARPNADWMIDGLDNDGLYGVDDPLEAETAPPYPVYIGDNGADDNLDGTPDDANEQNANIFPRPIPTMLRGIEVRIRMYEPGTRQTRQATVMTDFIPE